MARIVVLVTSPRLPAGLLTAAAWDLLRGSPIFASSPNPLTEVLGDLDIAVEIVDDRPTGAVVPALERLLAVALDRGTAVWLAGPSGDSDLAGVLALRLAREPGVAELEVCYGSWDPPGARLLDVVTVMDRLVSPGGDPWRSEQTHQTLARFLLEEAYEAYDAIGAHDLDALREELGDLLLQVTLHARMAEDAEPPWSVDDVAGLLVEKLVRRNPHVFGSTDVVDIDEITANWERIKREEKARDSALDGIVLAQPALALAAKVLSRAARAGVRVPLGSAPAEIRTEADLGAALLALVEEAESRGLDAEGALRRAALARIDALRAAESR